MSANPRLLVVDDENVICQACRRIFFRQGFQVEVSTDAVAGLQLAKQGDFAVILLDIKMPKMDGIQFLESLRGVKPDQPVLIITGYPSVPNAAAAIRLGASDYVTKPFTPEEITRSVQRVLGSRKQVQAPEQVPAAGAESPPAPAAQTLFLDEAWFRLEADGSACIGAVLPGLRGAKVQGVRLPRIGEVVYQGLPVAAVLVEDKPPVIVRSPVSGVVAGVNEGLSKAPASVVSDPCGEGWIACVCTTRFEEEASHCKPRRVILVNASPQSAEQQSGMLTSLGCQVRLVPTSEELPGVLREADCQVLLLDGCSLGDSGPDVVGRINALAPSMKVIVLACSDALPEAAYRKHHILYYAVAPFADSEIVDVLDAAFRAPERHPARPERARVAQEAVASIAITNRSGHKIHLLSAPGLLRRNDGLGWLLIQKLQERLFPITVTPGEANVSPASVLKAAGACDRLMVLLAKDSGLLPGGLARDTKPDFGVPPGDAAGKLTMLGVQPDAVGGLSGLDARTTAALAEHIVSEMASY
jgi:DNA-binding response OmpR family regulator